jgi:hypothetical protein
VTAEDDGDGEDVRLALAVLRAAWGCRTSWDQWGAVINI